MEMDRQIPRNGTSGDSRALRLGRSTNWNHHLVSRFEILSQAKSGRATQIANTPNINISQN
jgi:hypothetical protein